MLGLASVWPAAAASYGLCFVRSVPQGRTGPGAHRALRLQALDVDASGQMLAKASSCGVGGGEHGAFSVAGRGELLGHLVVLTLGM